MRENERSALRRDRFGFVFQFGQLVPELTAEANVALPLLLGGARRADALALARAWFGRLGLDRLKRRRSGELSGGECQRVALARSLVARPEQRPCPGPVRHHRGCRGDHHDRRRPWRTTLRRCGERHPGEPALEPPAPRIGGHGAGRGAAKVAFQRGRRRRDHNPHQPPRHQHPRREARQAVVVRPRTGGPGLMRPALPHPGARPLPGRGPGRGDPGGRFPRAPLVPTAIDWTGRRWRRSSPCSTESPDPKPPATSDRLPSMATDLRSIAQSSGSGMSPRSPGERCQVNRPSKPQHRPSHTSATCKERQAVTSDENASRRTVVGVEGDRVNGCHESWVPKSGRSSPRRNWKRARSVRSAAVP
jgi:hypothetical protein